MNISMTTNVKYTVEQRRLLRNSRCLLTDSGSLYLQFKPTVWAQSYPRKHTNCTSPLQERHFSDGITSCRKTAVMLKLSNVTFAVLRFNRQNLMLISPPND